MTCGELVELVTDYFEDALSIPDRTRFEQHVAVCPPCRVYLDQMLETIRQLGRIPKASLSPEADRTLVAAFQDWKWS